MTALAVIRGSALWLSSQAVGVMTVCLAWTLDAGGRLLLGVHPAGFTAYMGAARSSCAWIAPPTHRHAPVPDRPRRSVAAPRVVRARYHAGRARGGKQAAFDFLRRVRIAHNAVSLGGVETLVCHPATTTHSELSREERDEYGVSDALVRLSIGVEDWRDLLADFRQALGEA